MYIYMHIYIYIYKIRRTNLLQLPITIAKPNLIQLNQFMFTVMIAILFLNSLITE